MMALAKLLATLVNDAGDVAVEGVRSFDWQGGDLSEPNLRAGSADVPRA